jgi:hypothetical protein
MGRWFLGLSCRQGLGMASKIVTQAFNHDRRLLAM